jgi:hypothetical protein
LPTFFRTLIVGRVNAFLIDTNAYSAMTDRPQKDQTSALCSQHPENVEFGSADVENNVGTNVGAHVGIFRNAAADGGPVGR